MKEIDKYTMDVIKIPSLVLMERAAIEIVAQVTQYIKKEDRILWYAVPVIMVLMELQLGEFCSYRVFRLQFFCRLREIIAAKKCSCSLQ